MLLTDYFTSEHDLTWDYAKQCGVQHGVIRLPEDENFDITDFAHWENVHKKYMDFGIKPVVIEPLPNELHDHIKAGDGKRDECIEKVMKMFEYMDKLDIRTLCFNWMAHIGWLRTSDSIKERGGALVTGFDIADFKPNEKKITEKQLWDNYEYFIKAVIPYAEKYNIKLALHPDDPPVAKLGDVERIMISYENIEKAMSVVKSPHPHFTGVTPDKKYICVADLGLDAVFLYDRELNFVFKSTVPNGHGARHLAFRGNYLYCANELKSTLSVFKYDEGTLEYKSTVSVLPDGFSGESTVSAIRIKDNFCCVVNRGHDSISVLDISAEEPKLITTVPCGGTSPRDFNIIDDILICANEKSDNVSFFKIVNGIPRNLLTELKIKNAFCILC